MPMLTHKQSSEQYSFYGLYLDLLIMKTLFTMRWLKSKITLKFNFLKILNACALLKKLYFIELLKSAQNTWP